MAAIVSGIQLVRMPAPGAVIGGARVLLLGLEEPLFNARSENESLYVDCSFKVVISPAHLFGELAALERG